VKVAETPPAAKVAGLSAAKQKEFDYAKASLKAEKAKLQTAKGELDAIKPVPANLADLNKLHQTASDAIALADTALGEAVNLVTAITSAGDAAGKATALTAAVTQVDKAVVAVTTAVDAVKLALDAINLALPATYDKYTKAYKAYTDKKEEYEVAAKKDNYMAVHAGGDTPAEKIAAAEVTLDKAVTTIQKTIPANIVKLDEKAFSALTDDTARKATIVAVTEATDAYTTAIKDIKTASTTYTTAKTSVIAAAKQKLDEAKEAVIQSETDVNNKKTELGGSGPSKDEDDVASINQAIRELEILVSQNKTLETTAQKEYDALKQKLPQAGGSKQSKSKSSSSKSNSKSKNKTKKNHHSTPKSSKSKTPKIIMNE
jgi:hypothetical protein